MARMGGPVVAGVGRGIVAIAVGASILGVATPGAADPPSSPNVKCDSRSSPPIAVIEACAAALQDPALTPVARADLVLIRGRAEEF